MLWFGSCRILYGEQWHKLLCKQQKGFSVIGDVRSAKRLTYLDIETESEFPIYFC